MPKRHFCSPSHVQQQKASEKTCATKLLKPDPPCNKIMACLCRVHTPVPHQPQFPEPSKQRLIWYQSHLLINKALWNAGLSDQKHQALYLELLWQSAKSHLPCLLFEAYHHQKSLSICDIEIMMEKHLISV